MEKKKGKRSGFNNKPGSGLGFNEYETETLLKASISALY
jgi:hypothetical protein